MSKGLRFLLVGLVCLAVAYCGGGSSDEPSSSNQTAEDVRQLSVADTIGVEMGDSSYVFGQIIEVAEDGEGNVYVLDSSTMNIRKYSPDGIFIGSAGRQGTGPGEFQRPRCMTILHNDDIAVSDMMGGVISIFSNSLVWQRNLSGFFPRPPFTITAAGDSSFVGMIPSFDREEGTMGYRISRMEGQAEPSVTYVQEMSPFDPSRIGPLGRENNPVFTSDDSGRVFIAEHTTDAVNVTGYTPGGEVFLTIDEEIRPVEKSSEELAEEEAEFQEFASRMGSRGGRMSGMDLQFNPITYRRSVSELEIDDSERLWVRIGTVDHPFWRVYDLEGNLLFKAELDHDDPDIDEMVVRIGGRGAVGWVPDPTTWPRVLLLELPGD
ncbi:MAG: hypothetical protein GF388_11320 [Candidatus Aegiribacteria sp.]|nr:hypothetical protein [Candidatus Aegiribacteria sp.]MBD3295583.1 hypothetical protein [Candidatus Fermentibacteria bacterium]